MRFDRALLVAFERAENVEIEIFFASLDARLSFLVRHCYVHGYVL